MPLAKYFQGRQATHVGQPIIEQDQVQIRIEMGQFKGPGAGGCLQHLGRFPRIEPLQHLAQPFTDQSMIVNHENLQDRRLGVFIQSIFEKPSAAHTG